MNNEWKGSAMALSWLRHYEKGSQQSREHISAKAVKCNKEEEIIDRLKSVQPHLEPASFQVFLDEVFIHLSNIMLGPKVLPLMQKEGWEMGDVFWSFVRTRMQHSSYYQTGNELTFRSLMNFLKPVAIPSSTLSILARQYAIRPNDPRWPPFLSHPSWSQTLKVDKHVVWRMLNDKAKSDPKQLWVYADRQKWDAKMFIKRLVNLGSPQEIVSYLPLVVAGVSQYGEEILTPSRRKMLFEKLSSAPPYIASYDAFTKAAYDEFMVYLSKVSLSAHIQPQVKEKPAASKRKI